MRSCGMVLMACFVAMPASGQPAPATAPAATRAGEQRPNVVSRMTPDDKVKLRQSIIDAAGRPVAPDTARCRSAVESLPCASGTTGDFGPPGRRTPRPYAGGADLTR